MASTRKPIAENRKARHDYHILERLEAGIALTGTEVKSLRDGGGNIREAYAQLHDGEVFLVGANIAPYRQGNLQNHEPTRERKLLLHRREIEQLGRQVAERGMTIVPLQLYFVDGKVKLELGLARGKEGDDEPMPVASDLGVVLDGDGEPLCVVRTTAVEVRPFGDVDEEFAWTEGEGDRSLAYWRAAHIRFFATQGTPLEETTPVVLEGFDLVWDGRA